MGLREAIVLSVILGSTLVAGADPHPSTAAKHAKPAAAAAKAERADPKPDAKPAAEADGAAAGADAAAPEAAEEQAPPHIVGPRKVELGNQVAIDLPEGMWLFERHEAQELLKKGGNSGENVVGIVVKPDSEWFLSIEYDDSGYVDDSDAKDLDAGELLDSYREGTAEQNKRRKELGIPDLVIDDWSEKPRYDKPAHQLAWGIAGHTIKNKSINFVTRILGRNGYVSTDLVDAPERIDGAKTESAAVLKSIQFHPGARYEDHASNDKSSGVGLRGLVLGGAGVALASKLGLFAKLLLVFKKAFIVVFAGIAGAFRWLFRRKRAEAEPIARHGGLAPAAPPPPEPPPADLPVAQAIHVPPPPGDDPPDGSHT